MSQVIRRKIYEISQEISDDKAQENRDLILRNFKDFSDNPESINLQQMWKLCKKVWPKHSTSIPTAKRSQKGKIVSGPREIRQLLATEYKDRLRSGLV